MSANFPSVYRAKPIATWKMTENWGPNLGDSTDISISRTPGHSLQIRYGRNDITIPEKMIPWFADSVRQAAVWQDIREEPVA
jgi:hypothetical protein